MASPSVYLHRRILGDFFFFQIDISTINETTAHAMMGRLWQAGNIFQKRENNKKESLY